MCFDHGDNIPILRQGWRRAKKEHKCSECSARIQPKELYNYACGADEGRMVVWKICESCIIIAAFFYAKERAEGCAEWESHPPLGTMELRHEYMDWEGWSIDPAYADEAFEPDLNEPQHFVTRWSHIDAARSGQDLSDRPYTARVRERLRAAGAL